MECSELVDPMNGRVATEGDHGDDPLTVHSGTKDSPPSVVNEIWWLGSEGEVRLQK